MVSPKLDTLQVLSDKWKDVYEDDNEELFLQEFDGINERMRRVLNSKFYYAGGCCRYMFKYTTFEVIEKWENALYSKSKLNLIKDCAELYHEDEINQFRLYGISSSEQRIPVSAYVTKLFINCGPKVIAAMGKRLNQNNSQSTDGHMFEWWFFARIRMEWIEVFGKSESEDPLPKGEVLILDPTRPFKMVENEDGIFVPAKSMFWLKPVEWNQGGYDAVYIDSNKRKVIFVQVTISHQRTFKMQYFYEVLQHLQEQTGHLSWKLVIYFLVQEKQLMKFKFSLVEDHGLLAHFDPEWTGKEEDHVKSVR